MVQFFYHLNGVKLVSIDGTSVSEVANIISKKEHIDESSFYLVTNGRILRNDSQITDLCNIQVQFRLLGGKGGFGAMLKRKAKVSNPNATLDFSACRDLNGRRMRYVNATVAIQKWKERLNRLEELKATKPDATLDDVPMETPKGGIYGWYSDVPNWADGIKRTRNAYIRDQKKQKMCIHWWKAHQSGKVPPNADKDYGCPLGSHCEYAHGVDELTGQGRAEFLREQERIKKEKENEKIEKYVNYEVMTDSAVNAIDAGLKLKKKEKKEKLRKKDLSPLSFDDFDTPFPSKKSTKKNSKTKSSTKLAFASKLSLLTGKANIQDDGIIYASSAFPSIRLGNITVVSGRYYYEVHILSNGLVQLGWCSKNNSCNEADANGVGDCEQSWSFDIARGKTWHGTDSDYGVVCNPGDIVGCLFDADKQTLSYSINGKNYGNAFESYVTAIGGLFPAISLEQEETVLVNLGQFPFEYEVEPNTKAVWDFVKIVNSIVCKKHFVSIVIHTI